MNGLRICGPPKVGVALTLMATALATTSGKVQYWVPIEGEWYPVPPEAVIKTQNPVGEAIVWYLGPEGEMPREQYRIICFVPSGDV